MINGRYLVTNEFARVEIGTRWYNVLKISFKRKLKVFDTGMADT